MRYLGQFPSESDLKDIIIPELIGDDASKDGMVAYDAFERLMLTFLLEKRYNHDDAETLLAAFHVLDPEPRRGYIDQTQLHEYLSTRGGKAADGFREKEMNEFLDYAKDKESADSSRIYYEDYIAKLIGDVQRHIEKTYQEARDDM